jgi:hypothetical protein
MMIRSALFCFIILGFSGNLVAQGVPELEKRHGFKDIRLQTSPDSVKGAKFKKELKDKDDFITKLYTVDHPDYARIGEVKVKSLELKSYRDLIFEITVIVDKDPRVMKALESLYGKAEFDAKNETYFWKSESLILKFKPSGKTNLELLYSSFAVIKQMKEDKKKKVEDIANDF